MIHLKRCDSKTKWLPAGVLLLVGLALFPYGWLAGVWPGFARVVDFVFGTELAHVAGHSALFALMGAAVLFVFPRWQQHPRAYFILMLFLAAMQEFLQLVSFKYQITDELLDLSVDLLAAGVVFFFFKRVKKGGD